MKNPISELKQVRVQCGKVAAWLTKEAETDYDDESLAATRQAAYDAADAHAISIDTYLEGL